MIVSVITPSYNRSEYLNKLNSSLENQTNKSFEWILVDDGSSDNTQEVFLNLKGTIDKKYFYKDNGGKHTALNLGVSKAKGELIVILDSDDILLPTAVETIINDWINLLEKENVAGIAYLKGYINSGKIVGDIFPIEGIFNNIDVRYHEKIKGDKCEVIRSDILKKYQFPEIANENFISECIVWNRISKKYNFAYRNVIIYLCEYLESGLSSNVRRLFMNNPVGVLIMENEKTTKEFPIKDRIISTLQYISYSKIANLSFKIILANSKNRLLTLSLYPFGLLLTLLKKSRIND